MITGRIGLHSTLLSLFIHSCSKSVKIKCNTITFFHPAAFECFNAVNPIASAFVEAGHVIALPFASAPTPVVVIFSNSQPRLGTREINGGRKFSEIKVQKPRVLMFVIH